MAKANVTKQIRELEAQKKALLEGSRQEFEAEIAQTNKVLADLKKEFKELFGVTKEEFDSEIAQATKVLADLKKEYKELFGATKSVPKTAPSNDDWESLISQIKNDELIDWLGDAEAKIIR